MLDLTTSPTVDALTAEIHGLRCALRTLQFGRCFCSPVPQGTDGQRHSDGCDLACSLLGVVREPRARLDGQPEVPLCYFGKVTS